VERQPYLAFVALFKTAYLILLSVTLRHQIEPKHSFACDKNFLDEISSVEESDLLSGTTGVWGRETSLDIQP
jgi:hypothetical protein